MDMMIKMNGSLQSIAAIRLGIEEENCKDGRRRKKHGRMELGEQGRPTQRYQRRLQLIQLR